VIFETLAEAERALKPFETNPEHTDLFEKQVNYLENAWAEFYEVLDC
jgi:hypothetical protein